MLTARDEEEDILRGLQIGADDYMTKPFSAKQLAARMKAVCAAARPTPTASRPPGAASGDLVLDLQSHEVTKAGKPVQLTRLEFRILYMLALNEGRIIPYSRLIEYAWGYYDEGNSNLLKTHICHIRKKLGLGAASAASRPCSASATASPGTDPAPRPRGRPACGRPARPGGPRRRSPSGLVRYHLPNVTERDAATDPDQSVA